MAEENATKTEFVDPPELLNTKISQLIQLIKNANYFVVYTGAGISTSANVPDFRGDHGLSTKGILGLRESDLDFIMPTYSHMAIMKLLDFKIAKFLVTSNHDNLHVKSGVSVDNIAELFGNAYVEKCTKCHIEYRRKTAAPNLGRICDNSDCKGKLLRTGVRFGQATPKEPLERGDKHSRKADLALVLGSSMSVSPFCELPKYAKRVVIVNLQTTPYDKSATIKINAYCDDVMRAVIPALSLILDDFTYRQGYVIGHRLVKETNTKFLFLESDKPNEAVTCVDTVTATFTFGTEKVVLELEKTRKNSMELEIPNRYTNAGNLNVEFLIKFKEEFHPKEPQIIQIHIVDNSDYKISTLEFVKIVSYKA